jgi:23S rRNA pseudouridine1911/1915/1917 synthase
MMQTSPEPFILTVTDAYVLVYKPPALATAPLAEGEGDTLVAWCIGRFPEVGKVAGKKAIEGGLLHRLDRDTNGLVVFARNQSAYDALIEQQEQGRFIKRYRAWCQSCDTPLLGPSSGFPHPPCRLVIPLESPLEISSPFRPYGPGRKQVRPVVSGKYKELALDRGKPYKTIIRSAEKEDDPSSTYKIDVEISRGFRHQIRCHLAWLGFPIIGDPLYNPCYRASSDTKDPLALQAWAVEFIDPDTKKAVRYELTSSTDTGGIV